MDPPNDPLPVLLRCYRALQHAREALYETRADPPQTTRWGPRTERVARVLARVDDALDAAEPLATAYQREQRGGRALGPAHGERERAA